MKMILDKYEIRNRGAADLGGGWGWVDGSVRGERDRINVCMRVNHLVKGKMKINE